MRIRIVLIALVLACSASAVRAQSYDSSSRPIILSERDAKIKILEDFNRRLNRTEEKLYGKSYTPPPPAPSPAYRPAYYPTPAPPTDLKNVSAELRSIRSTYRSGSTASSPRVRHLYAQPGVPLCFCVEPGEIVYVHDGPCVFVFGD